ncbi:hypothetical protein G7074_13250 [Pedobacter sp. HDW13]|uniref:hypothetical protein n=1 Tax=unclassified Pedobacter TaxID=2628915 RepID=UPI000F59EE8E|nr:MULTISPECIES: hypothetical protein [unclassified Pedobacter]QIL40145.1 hypothetical protein G7074_13250 [Pedobacter sp. HDW13]RQO68388.1 hypothetical protein DBR40_20815 [Pedobacter sp. KBW01]
MKRLPKALEVCLLILSIILSFILAVTTPKLNQLELGAMFNFTFPWILGIITLILLFIISLITQNKKIRIAALCILSGCNITLGILFHFA